ncbi:hypothetical protein QE401_000500 [Pseudoroseomonas cervicalis]|nr:hypothetical protein [Pseudoroseomonas cervicalis]
MSRTFLLTFTVSSLLCGAVALLGGQMIGVL